MKVVKKVKDERAEGGGDIWGCTINQAIVAAVPNSFLCGKKYLAYGACKLPDSQHFVRGSADLHIFTVRTKLVIFQSITLPAGK